MRKAEFDILKGILIVFVVIGHIVKGDSTTHNIIFWFHMPLFLMISGYFIKDVTTENTCFNNILLKLFTRYCIPYFSWSFLLFVFIHPESLLKYIARVILGGANNSLVFTYPFWYINALPLCLLVMNIIQYKFKKNSFSILGLIAVISYSLVHAIDIVNILPVRLPFSSDAAIGCFPYLFCGYILKRFEWKWKFMVIIVIPIAMIILRCHDIVYYELDMKQMKYTSWLLDFVVPISFAISLYGISLLLFKTNLKVLLCSLGERCITIYFVHAGIIYLTEEILHPVLEVIVVLVSGYAIHELCKTNEWTSRLFLGVNIN